MNETKIQIQIEKHEGLIQLLEDLKEEQGYLDRLNADIPPSYYAVFATTGELARDRETQQRKCDIIKKQIEFKTNLLINKEDV